MVELGEKRPVDGVPLAQIAARFVYGVPVAEIRRREGETSIRTPQGPRALGDVLEQTDETYFATRREFETTVRESIGDGPVPIATDRD